MIEHRAPVGGQRWRVEVQPGDGEAGRRVEREPPRERRHDRDGAVGDQHRGADRRAGEDRAVHRLRDQHAEHELEQHRDHGDEHRVGEGAPPRARGEHGDVVGEPDELAGVREAQVGATQREPERVEDREARHQQHHGDGGRAQHPGELALGPRAVGQAARLCGGRGGGRASNCDGHQYIPPSATVWSRLLSVSIDFCGLIPAGGCRESWIASVTSE